MRSALSQLFRTRHHKGLTRRTRRGIDLFDCPSFEPMRPRIGLRSEISERNEAIGRYLTSQVGRPFDEVYKELCSRDGDAKLPREIVEAVANMVHRNTTVADGVVCLTSGESFDRDFFVHPEDGTLQAANDPAAVSVSDSEPEPELELQPRTRRRTRFNQIDVDRIRKYVQINGVWFIVRFAEINEAAFNAARTRADKAELPLIYDWVFRTELPRDFNQARVRLEREWGAPVYAVEKRQIAKREVRRINRRLAAQVN